MQICRFNDNRLGCIEGGQVLDVTQALEALPPIAWPMPPGDLLVANLDAVCQAVETLRGNARRYALDEISFASPVANPSKIIAAPGNYRKHVEQDTLDAEVDAGVHREKMLASTAPAETLGLFLKANTSLVGPGEGVTLPKVNRRVDYECELAVIIGRKCKHVRADEALSCVAGYAVGLDMSFRGAEDRSFRKSADTFTVLGPWLVTADEIADPSKIDLSLAVNEVVRQRSNTALLTVGINRLIEMASAVYTLYPGDILLTGTPEGVGPVVAGDVMRAYCAGIGEMEVRVL